MIGLVTAVAVAWGFSAMGEASFKKRERFWMEMVGENQMYVTEGSSIGRTQRQPLVRILDPGPPAEERERTVREWRSTVETSRELGNLPSWPKNWGIAGEWEQKGSCQYAAGWPVRCMWYQRDMVWGSQNGTPGFRLETHGGFEITHGVSTSANAMPSLRVLPLRPIWAGLAVNTAMNAGVIFLLIGGVRGLRQWRRRSRQRCGACGYHLRGLTSGRCPECGAEAPIRVPEVTTRDVSTPASASAGTT